MDALILALVQNETRMRARVLRAMSREQAPPDCYDEVRGAVVVAAVASVRQYGPRPDLTLSDIRTRVDSAMNREAEQAARACARRVTTRPLDFPEDDVARADETFGLVDDRKVIEDLLTAVDPTSRRVLIERFLMERNWTDLGSPEGWLIATAQRRVESGLEAVREVAGLQRAATDTTRQLWAARAASLNRLSARTPGSGASR